MASRASKAAIRAEAAARGMTVGQYRKLLSDRADRDLDGEGSRRGRPGSVLDDTPVKRRGGQKKRLDEVRRRLGGGGTSG
jgi:hypothetical protein